MYSLRHTVIEFLWWCDLKAGIISTTLFYTVKIIFLYSSCHRLTTKDVYNTKLCIIISLFLSFAKKEK